MILRAIIITFGLAASVSASAQIDPSSALLLNGSRDGTSTLDSGRYQIRPKTDSTRKEEQRTNQTRKTREEENPDPVTVMVPAEGNPAGAPAAANGQPVVLRCDEFGPCPQPAALTPQPRASSRRLNLMELSFAPGYLYNGSDSTYSYRSYTSSTPTLTADASVWLSMGFALHGSYTGTLGGHVSDSNNGSKNVPAMQEWFTAGFRWRKFFGSEPRSPTMYFGLSYYDYQFRVSGDAVLREKLRSTGVQLTLDTEVPVSETRAWTIGASFAPKLRHSELATGVDFQSGGNVDANDVGISVGGRVQFERHDAIYWKFTQSVEKDLFSGDATKADPQSGVTPKGVAVTNSFSRFEIGYSWGH